MFTLPTGTTIPDEDLSIWKAYDYKCTVHADRYAVCLHECPPKSLNPKWRDMPESRYPVCLECHDNLHEINWRAAETTLQYYRAKNFPHALENL
jgi:hypothetical protein